MKEKYIIWKHLGETPLEALERLRTDEGIAAEVPMTYAGRLDPAAEGLLVILVGEECKKKDEYTALSKTYLAEILIGVSTDSFDLLGIPALFPPPARGGEAGTPGGVVGENTMNHPLPRLDKGGEKILKFAQEYLDAHLGSQKQKYPPYSSKTLRQAQGRPLPPNESEELPGHEVSLQEYSDLSIDSVLKEDLYLRIGELAAAVTGDFRQKEIVEAWAELDLPEKLPLLSVTLTVSSGFYVRQFAEDLGKELGVGACLYSLIRTKVGEYDTIGQ